MCVVCYSNDTRIQSVSYHRKNTPSKWNRPLTMYERIGGKNRRFCIKIPFTLALPSHFYIKMVCIVPYGKISNAVPAVPNREVRSLKGLAKKGKEIFVFGYKKFLIGYDRRTRYRRKSLQCDVLFSSAMLAINLIQPNSILLISNFFAHEDVLTTM